MQLSPEISSIQLVLLCAALAATAMALLIFLLRILPVTRCRRSCDEAAAGVDMLPDREGASIIVYSDDEAAALEQLLPVLLSQRYNSEYEVIVVNEGESPAVHQLVEDLRVAHHNLYLTYTPDGARNLSRRKLALTLGIKAARYPVVVLTTASAVVTGDHWLALMMSHFSPRSHTEIVLGYGTAPAYDDHAVGARTRSFDYVADSVDWLSAALRGKPWRGMGDNIAYRRELFFRARGFASHLNLRYGDDDIFVARVATAGNTAVELALDSMTALPGANSPAAARRRFTRRRFTRRFISRRPRLSGSLGWWCYLLGLVLPVAAASLPPHDITTLAAATLAIALWLPVALVWRGACTALCGRRLLLTLPLLAATRPLRQLWRTARAMMHRSKQYTWQ